MLRSLHVADVVTLCNAACGTLSVLAAMAHVAERQAAYFYLACALVPLGLFFDIMDGRVARWRQKSSDMGRELDSLSDVISFGLAPAAIGYAAGLREAWHAAVLVFFVCCGVSRLARYNVTADSIASSSGKGKVTYFEGTPIPTSVLVVFLLACSQATGLMVNQPFIVSTSLALVYVLLGCAMVSKSLRIPKF